MIKVYDIERMKFEDIQLFLNATILTSNRNVHYYKKKLAQTDYRTASTVYSYNEYLSKILNKNISSIKEKMLLAKILLDEGIKYPVDMIDDFINLINDEANYKLENIGTSINYEKFKTIKNIFLNCIKEEKQIPSLNNLIITDLSINLKELDLLKELINNSSNTSIYINSKNKIELNNLSYLGLSVDEKINKEIETKNNFYHATDLYDEVLFAANMIAKNYSGNLNDFTITAPNIDEYINYIDLIFKENNINYNYPKKVNTLLIENIINKKLSGSKKEVLTKIYNLIKDTDNDTYDFLISFMEEYNEIFEDLALFNELLSYFKSKTIPVLNTNSVNILNIENVFPNKIIFFLGVNEGELLPKKYSNSIVKYSELNKIYSNYPIDNFVLKFEKAIADLLNSSEFIYFTAHKINARNTQAHIDSLITKLDFCEKFNSDDSYLLTYLKSSFYNKLPFLNYSNIEYNNFSKEINKFYNPKLNYEVDKLSLSPSKMDIYNNCYFSYYCKYILDLKDNDFSFDNRVIGSYIHYLFEKILPSEDIDEVVNDCEKVYLEKYPTFKEEFLIKKISDNFKELYPIVLKELKDSEYEIKDKELNIALNPLYINVLGKEVLINGIIDRVDESANYIRLIDYKTGVKKFNLNEFDLGINLQLFIYMLYCEKIYGKEVSGMFYQKALLNKDNDYRLYGILKNDEEVLNSFHPDNEQYLDVYSRGKLDSKSCFSASKLKELTLKTEELIKETAVHIFDGDIDINPIFDNKMCDYCQYKSICGIEKSSKQYRYLAKEESIEVDVWILQKNN